MGGDFASGAIKLAGLTGTTLGWRPDEFWNATPAELAAIFAALSPESGNAIGAGDLAQLMEQFPDG